MMKGKVHATLDLLSTNGRRGVLELDHKVKSDGSNDMSMKYLHLKKHSVANLLSSNLSHLRPYLRYIQLCFIT